MTKAISDSPAELPLTVALQVEAECGRFEEAWRAGQRPRIEDYVGELPEPGCSALLYELLRIDVHYRRLQGENPLSSDYLRRFPTVELAWIDRAVAAPADSATPLGDTPSPTAAPPVGLSAETTRDYPAVPGYEILAVLGRGGMGVVYKARHVQLDRLVALKMILAGDHAGPEELARFRREAEAVAQLQQPHIVQIYEIGEQQGRPYFALEYVDGGSLGQKIAGSPQPPREAAQLVETLARAMQHAHDRGILHRDLKPANVLLSGDWRVASDEQCSEVERQSLATRHSPLATPKITDFGLAKRLHAEVGQTQSGALVGTPSYMAPEQAEGKTGALGPTTDVYALGAILYEMLTGRPPFRAATMVETLDQVRTQDPVAPTQFQSKLPRDLETICLKCLLKEPAKRYVSAQALADELGRFLRNEPIEARPVGRIERCGRWCRRNPALAGLAGTMILVVASGFAAVTWQWLRAETSLGEANRQRQRADGNFRKARDAVDQMLTRVGQVQLSNVPQMEPVRRALLEDALKFYRGFLDEESSDPAVSRETGRAYRRVGNIHVLLGEHVEAEEAFHNGIGLLKKAATDSPNLAECRHELSDCYQNLGTLLLTVNRFREAEDALHCSLQLADKLVTDFSKEAEYRSGLARCYSNLGEMYRRLDRHQDAEDACRRALPLFEALAIEFPRDARYRESQAACYNNLALVLAETGQTEKAEAASNQALTIEEKLVEEFPNVKERRQRLARSHHNFAVFLLRNPGEPQARSLPEVEKHCRRALELEQRLVADFPGVPEFRQELAGSYNVLGNLLVRDGRLAQAEEAYRQTLPVLEKLVADFPNDPDSRLQLAQCHGNLGGLLSRTGRTQEAENRQRLVLELKKKLVEDFPTVPSYQSGLGVTLRNLAVALRDRGELAAARQLFQEAIDHQRAALKPDSRNVRYRDYLADAYRGLAETLVRLGDHEAAAETSAQMGGLFVDAGQLPFLAACFLARCVPLAEGDEQLPEEKRMDLGKRYGDRAIEYLRLAIAHGFKDSEKLAKNAKLDPLRAREDFRRLMSELVAP